MNTKQENWLVEAIKILKGKGIVKRDKDVADKTGYSKVSISGMLSGNVKISNKFRTKFYEVFGDFLVNQAEEPVEPYGNERIKELKYTIEVQRDFIAELKEKVYRQNNQKKAPVAAH